MEKKTLGQVVYEAYTFKFELYCPRPWEILEQNDKKNWACIANEVVKYALGSGNYPPTEAPQSTEAELFQKAQLIRRVAVTLHGGLEINVPEGHIRLASELVLMARR